MTNLQTEITVILINNGSILIQWAHGPETYTHSYDDPGHAAHDYSLLTTGANPAAEWDAPELEIAIVRVEDRIERSVLGTYEK